jgi:hypothetical protein
MFVRTQKLKSAPDPKVTERPNSPPPELLKTRLPQTLEAANTTFRLPGGTDVPGAHGCDRET